MSGMRGYWRDGEWHLGDEPLASYFVHSLGYYVTPEDMPPTVEELRHQRESARRRVVLKRKIRQLIGGVPSNIESDFNGLMKFLLMLKGKGLKP